MPAPPRARHFTLQDAPDFFQFLHQIHLGVEAPGSVDENDVDAAGPRRVNRIEGDARRIGTGLVAHDLHAGAISPQSQLIGGGGAKCVAGGHQHRLALRGVPVRELANRGGFADAIDAHEEDDERRPGAGSGGH